MIAATTAVPVDDELLASVLACYKPHCRYLRSAGITSDAESVRCAGLFEIPESCYIDSTGHLNAVEVNICVNQMLYTAIAAAVVDDLIAPFDRWSMDDFRVRQLPDVLITSISSEFRRPIDPRSFTAELTLSDIVAKTISPGTGEVVSMRGRFDFTDHNAGQARGSVRVAVVPAGAQLRGPTDV